VTTTVAAKPPAPAAAPVAAPVTPARPIDLYHRFIASQSAEVRAEVVRLPVVVVLGERVRGGQSALVEAGLGWRATNRKLRPSLSDDDAPVRFYLGDELVAIELAIATVDDDGAAVRDGLAELFGELRGRDVSAVVAIEQDTLDPGAVDVLVARAERIRAKLDLLAAAIGAGVEARLCIVVSDGNDGFADLARVLARAGRGVPIDIAAGAPPVATIISKLADVLPSGLTTLAGDAFARLVGFLAHVDGFATALAAFLAAFSTPAGSATTARLTVATIFLAEGTLVGAPFPMLDRSALRPAPAPSWRHVAPRCLLAAACATLPFAAGPLFAAISWAPPVAPIADASVDARFDANHDVFTDAAAGPGAGANPDAFTDAAADAGAPAICPPSPPEVQIDLRVSPTERAVGIDISSYDRAPLPWAALKAAGVSFVYIKASEGMSTDPAFAAHWRDAKACGILRGAYHLVRFNDDPAAQAAVFATKLGADLGELPPAIDVENSAVQAGDHAPGATCASLQDALDVLTRRIATSTGRVPAIYTSIDAWQPLEACGDKLADRPLWLKYYGSPQTIRLFAGWASWMFWQRTGAATITGERRGEVHQIDVDEFTGTLGELRARVPGGGAR
jgi:GH25 family lysozyme M1 (1,4-beta-N-acetylmuramidase)